MTPVLTPILDIAELRAIEARYADAGLMERAGAAAAEAALRLCGDRGRPVVVLAGPGNNGGDGFVVARLLRGQYHDVHVVFAGHADRLPDDAHAAYRAFVAAGGATHEVPPAHRPALVVDGLFGIGLTRSPEGRYAELVEWANASGAPILAIDIPTGLDAATGQAHAPAIRAFATATFIALKPGLLTADGPDQCGDISVHGLDLPVDGGARGRRLDWPSLAAALPPVLARRTRNVNKGTFGTLGILGGTEGMGGALILAGRAAMRTGAGKVWLGFLMADPPKLDTGMPELMLRHAGAVLDAQPDALVVGPGLGTSDAARTLLMRALALQIPIALDADALNLLARDPALLAATQARGAPTLATPHPGEAARLLGASVDSVQNDRMGAARELSRRLVANVVLKGAGSVLAHPDGTWDINASGGPALATAGSGDVLSGLLGALLAQQLDARTALRYAVCLHGAAADALVADGSGPLGATASELPDAARALLNAAARNG
ncbi:MAG TPA: NAD(P)H-hydrate dehydratase [Casimicrobiaceae bacterium]|nr:NAD(P)H-hydrate dehydratase [Casimicrobiaceae bacterium]